MARVQSARRGKSSPRPLATVRYLRPVERRLDYDTVRFLQALLSKALHGEVIGVACVAALSGPDRECEAYTAGQCRRNRTFTRGMLRHLDDVLADEAKA